MSLMPTEATIAARPDQRELDISRIAPPPVSRHRAATAEASVRRTRVLLIEDCQVTYEITRANLECQTAAHVDLLWARDLEQGLEMLRVGRFDAVLLDFHLPDSGGLESLPRIHEIEPQMPVLFLTVDEDRDKARAAVRAGAQEYLVKSRVQGESIARAVVYAIARQTVQNELEAAHAERLAWMSNLLSHVSHELRTPLASVHQFSTILRDGLAGEVNGEQKEYLEIIVANADRLTQMVQDLLDSSRAESGKLPLERQPVDLEFAIREVLETQKQAADSGGVSISAHLPSELPPAAGDPTQIVQILTNLVDNAIKFAPGGNVSLQAIAIGDSLMRVSVIDDGRGIAPGNREKVFSRLYQERPTDRHQTPGLGLGLYICRQYVEHHGGRIWVESELGKGSAFHFTLPQAYAPNSREESP